MTALTKFVADGFALSKRDITEVLPDLVAATEGHPQRAMLLAHLLFQQVKPRSAANAASLRAALDAALDRVDPEARDDLVRDARDRGERVRRSRRAVCGGLGLVHHDVVAVDAEVLEVVESHRAADRVPAAER